MPHVIGRLSALALSALVMAGPALAQNADQPPPAVQTTDTGRAFLDGQVAEVYVDNVKTVAVMAQATQSQCPSNEYVYERERPKWLYQTGRLLVAQEEGAQIRISFTCYSGLQSINAIQFLSPPPGPLVMRGTPSQARFIRTVPVDPQPAAGQGDRPPRALGTRQQTRPEGSPATAVSPGGVGAVRANPVYTAPPTDDPAVLAQPGGGAGVPLP